MTRLCSHLRFTVEENIRELTKRKLKDNELKKKEKEIEKKEREVALLNDIIS